MKKRIISAVLAIILAVVIITPAFAIVEPTEEFYVADYANVIRSDTEQYIIDANATLENTCNGAQIVVVSVEYLDGLYADEYALKVMNDWGVGSAKKDNGMVLVFATKENKGWLATGDGIDNVFSDNMANIYLDRYFWKHYDKGNYDDAVRTLLPQLVQWYKDNFASEGSMNFPGIENFFGTIADVILYNRATFMLFILFIYSCFKIPIRARDHYRAYYRHMGMPIPRFYIWHIWSGPHIKWHNPNEPVYGSGDYGGYHHHYHGSRGGYRSSGRSGGFSSSGRGGGGRSGGGGGGRR